MTATSSWTCCSPRNAPLTAASGWKRRAISRRSYPDDRAENQRHARRAEFRRRRETTSAHVYREGVPRLFDVRDPRSRVAVVVRRSQARATPHHLRDERARPLGRAEAQEERA